RTRGSRPGLHSVAAPRLNSRGASARGETESASKIVLPDILLREHQRPAGDDDIVLLERETAELGDVEGFAFAERDRALGEPHAEIARDVRFARRIPQGELLPYAVVDVAAHQIRITKAGDNDSFAPAGGGRVGPAGVDAAGLQGLRGLLEADGRGRQN